MLLSVVVTVTLIAHSLLFYSQHTQSYTIHGRVVDSLGTPVKNALVFYGRETGDVGSTFEGVKSDESGKFSLAVEGYMRLQPFFLFVTSEVPDKTMALMSPPFTENPRSIKRRFAGPRIILDKQKEVDAGNVLIKTTFLPVTLTILNEEGKHRLSTSNQWANVVVRLLDSHGNAVAARGMSQLSYKECVNLAESEIRVAVPEGHWRIEISITDFSGPFYGTTALLSKKDGDLQKISIVIPK